MPDDTLYQLFTGLEQRLMAYIDKSIEKVERLIEDQSQRTDDLTKTMATRLELADVILRVAELTKLFQDHISLPGHPLGIQRLENVEKVQEEEEKRQQGRPLTTWQIITVAIFAINSIIGTILGILNFLHHP